MLIQSLTQRSFHNCHLLHKSIYHPLYPTVSNTIRIHFLSSAIQPPLPKRKTFSQTPHSRKPFNSVPPSLPTSRLPHSEPVHQGGGGAGGIHGLKEIIIDWCGPCCWFSWTAAPRRQAERGRERLPALAFFHFLFNMACLWDFLPSCVSFCPSPDSLPRSRSPSLCVLYSKHMPLAITIRQSTRGKDKGAVTSSVSLTIFHGY